jgi:LCP family protein required for cell wall assembly
LGTYFLQVQIKNLIISSKSKKLGLGQIMKFFKFFVVPLLIVVILLVAGSVWFYESNVNALKSVHTGNQSVSQKVESGQPFSVLLLGTDTGAEGRVDRGNSDTMIVITVDPKDKKTILYSIPRDTMAQIAGQGQDGIQKINAAYNIGTSKTAKRTVQDLLNVPIDYTVVIDMKALEKTVDFVDGVDINSPMTVTQSGITIPKGNNHLYGKAALAYSRMRDDDPNGDYGRQLRQQQILAGVVQKMKQPKYLIKLPKLIKSLGTDASTDFTSQEISEIPLKYHSDAHFQSHQLLEQTAWINGSSYQVASTKKLQSASDTLRKSLGLPTEKLNNTETKLNARNQTFFDDPDNTTYNTYGLDSTFYTNDTY